MKKGEGVTAVILCVAGLVLSSAPLACIASAQMAPKTAASSKPAALIDVTVSEGTSMSVAVSPDGKTLAMDMQGSIWTLPASGGAAKRITGLFNDARQPVWSPDGKWITFFGYLDGGYDLWTIAPDGTHQHKLTWGTFDDREPAYSHDGNYVAFASDRDNPLGSSYNIWILDLRTGALKRITNDPSENHMPAWSPDDKDIVFSSTRDDGKSVWAANASRWHDAQGLYGVGRRECTVVGSRRKNCLQRRANRSKPTGSRRKASDGRRECICVSCFLGFA